MCKEEKRKQQNKQECKRLKFKTMKKLQYLAIASIASVFTFTSCSSDDNTDTEKPVVDLVAPAEGAKLEAGKDIHFDMVVSDNDGLASYNVDIHNNFDGHNHSGGDNHTHALGVKEVAAEGKPFAFNKTWDLGGVKNDKIHHHEIIIDANAKPGDYHFVVKVLDKSGNQTMVFRNIEIVAAGEGDGDHDHDHDHDDHNHAH